MDAQTKCDGNYFAVLRLSADRLLLEICHDEICDPETPELGLGEGDDLDGVLDGAVDGAAYTGDWQGLVRLRECLLRWAAEAEDALRQIAREGPYRDKVKDECASRSAP